VAGPRRTRHRARLSCPNPGLLVSPRPHPIRSSIRPPRRRRPDPRLIRKHDQTPPPPRRRPPPQPSALDDRIQPREHPSSNARLHNPTPPRRQNPTRSHPLPQTHHRQIHLPKTRNHELTQPIEASIRVPQAALLDHRGNTRSAQSRGKGRHRGWVSIRVRLRRALLDHRVPSARYSSAGAHRGRPTRRPGSVRGVELELGG